MPPRSTAPFPSMALLLAVLLTISACTPPPPPRSVAAPPSGLEALFDWNDDGGPGEISIYIERATQRAYFKRGERTIGWSYVATGTYDNPTPAGEFRITEKVVDKYSNRYGWIEDEYGNQINSDATPRDYVPPGGTYMPAPMPYWMRLTSYGIGMHAGPIPSPGSPASHGCIRLPRPLAPILFDEVVVGTPVTIE